MDEMRVLLEAAVGGPIPNAYWEVLVDIDVDNIKAKEPEMLLPDYVQLYKDLELDQSLKGLVITRSLEKPKLGQPSKAIVTWNGNLPPTCNTVDRQVLTFFIDSVKDEDGFITKFRKYYWETRTRGLARSIAIPKLEEMVTKGPVDHFAWRLVPSSKQSAEEGTSEMGKKASKVKKTSNKAPAELVAGKFRAGTFRAKLFQLLADGKKHNGDAIIKAIGATENIGKRTVKLFLGPIVKDLADAGHTVTVDGESYIMGKPNGVEPKKAAKKATRKTAKKAAPPKDESTDSNDITISE